jgi:hypothetical protein
VLNRQQLIMNMRRIAAHPTQLQIYHELLCMPPVGGKEKRRQLVFSDQTKSFFLVFSM